MPSIARWLTRCPVPGYLIEMQIVWWWHRGWWYHLIVFTLSAHLHILSTRCLITGDIPLPGWRPAPALACLHKDIPLPTPSLARLHTDPRFRIEVTLESSLTMIYVLLYP